MAMEVEPEQRSQEEEPQPQAECEPTRKRPRSPSPPADPMTLEDAEKEIQRGLRRAREADELEEAEEELRQVANLDGLPHDGRGGPRPSAERAALDRIPTNTLGIPAARLG